jgi:hypothetical protein
MPGNDDHVVINGDKFECRHCGESEEVGLPISLSDLEPESMAFLKKHSPCEESVRTKTIKFLGHSDDVIHVETIYPDGKKSIEEYGFKDSEDLAKFNIGNKMTIYAMYDGTWMFGVGQWDEDIPLPDWPVRFTGSSGYTVHFEVDVPGGMPFKQVVNEDEEG